MSEQFPKLCNAPVPGYVYVLAVLKILASPAPSAPTSPQTTGMCHWSSQLNCHKPCIRALRHACFNQTYLRKHLDCYCYLT